MSANFVAGTVSATFNKFKVQAVTADPTPSTVSWSFRSDDVPLTNTGFKDAVWKSGSGSGSGGTWSAMLFGPSGAAPTGIAGVFEAVPVPSTDYSLTGAFAASR